MTSTNDSKPPLAGRTVALPETRELALLAEMFEAQGATTVRCPMVAILDAPDPQPILAWLGELVAGKFDDLILLTGEGLRRLRGFARQAGTEPEVIEAIGKIRTITRGPKPAKALREIRLSPKLPADHPTTDGVIQTLERAAAAGTPLAGRHVAVQLYGGEPNAKLVEFLQSAGAIVHTVAPYVYAPASDTEKVASLIQLLADGAIDVIAFTSTPQVDRLWEVAHERGIDRLLRDGLAKTRVAAVGPVVADALRTRQVAISFQPESSFFMRPMLNEVVAALESTRLA